MFILAATLILIGIVYTEILPSSNPKVEKKLLLQDLSTVSNIQFLGHRALGRWLRCIDHLCAV